MADVNINIFTNKVYKQGASTVVPGFIEGEEPTPINPSGSGGASEFVPYVGATENFDLGEFGLSAGFLKLDTTPTNTPTDQGTMYWDEDDNTVDIVLNGYIMKVGEDLFYPVKNQTGSSIPKGTNVGFAGTLGMSGRLLITPYLANGANPTSRYMGVTAETIANGADGKVLWFGRIRGINTNAFNEGDILYASTSTAGAFQTTLPVAPNNIVEVAAVITKSSTQGVIFVRPQFLTSGGGSKWTDVGANIYRDSAVAIGRTTIPTNATFAVQSKSVTDGNIFFLVENSAGVSRIQSTNNGLINLNGGPTAGNNGGVTVKGIVGADNVNSVFRVYNSLDTLLFRVMGNGDTRVETPYLYVGNPSLPSGNAGMHVRGASTSTDRIFTVMDSANTIRFLVRGNGQINLSEGGNISLGTTTGTKIGTATTQKIGFWNATPIVQPTTAIAESAFVENSGGVNVNDDSTFDGYTLRQVVKALRDAGLLA